MMMMMQTLYGVSKIYAEATRRTNTMQYNAGAGGWEENCQVRTTSKHELTILLQASSYACLSTSS